MCTLDTLVEDTHGFISASDLHLHKVGLTVIAGWTNRHGPVNIFPSSCATQNIIDLFLLGYHFGCLIDGNGTVIGASSAVEERAAGTKRRGLVADLIGREERYT